MKKFFVFSLLPALILVSPARNPGHRPSARETTSVGRSAWEAIGPYGGNIQSLKANPSDPEEIFALTFQGHVCRSEDGGRAWRLVAVLDASPFHVHDLAFSPSHPNVLYVTATRAIFKSVDDGMRWAEFPLPDRTECSGNVWIDPFHADRILVAGSFEGRAALLKSDDGGRTWTPKTFTTAAYGSCPVIAVDLFNPDVIYASGWYGFSTRGPTFGNLYKTSDGGDAWNIIYGGTAPQTIMIDVTNPSRVYAGMSGGIYRSSDGGQTWAKNNGEATAQRLATDPAHPETLYGGSTAAVFRSLNGGADWTRISTGLEGSCAALLASGPRVLFGSNAGVFRSEDGENAWSASVSGMNALIVPSYIRGAKPRFSNRGNGAVQY
jgi:photosystem II stability/assembly factor-like uncharacterized protein